MGGAARLGTRGRADRSPLSAAPVGPRRDDEADGRLNSSDSASEILGDEARLFVDAR
jgi:hypothetical protein